MAPAPVGPIRRIASETNAPTATDSGGDRKIARRRSSRACERRLQPRRVATIASTRSGFETLRPCRDELAGGGIEAVGVAASPARTDSRASAEGFVHSLRAPRAPGAHEARPGAPTPRLKLRSVTRQNGIRSAEARLKRGRIAAPCWKARPIAVVVPAHNEEGLIAPTIQGIPGSSTGSTSSTTPRPTRRPSGRASVDDPRVEVIVHAKNGGVGAAIVTGYKRALAERMDATAVMAGDNQMDPDELEALALPVVRDELDYAKANRLFTGSAWKLIPRNRYLGNAVLSLLTKVASGYWHVADSQAGYTVISLRVLQLLDLDRIYTSYGFPNDMLVHLNVWNARVRDFPSRPIYGVGERSGIKIRRVVPRISWLLWKGFFWRHAREVRDPRLPPARLLLLPRLPDDDRRPRARHLRDGAAVSRQPHHAGDDRPRRAAPDLGQPVHAVRDVVRHGVEQGPTVRVAALGRRYASSAHLTW